MHIHFSFTSDNGSTSEPSPAIHLLLRGMRFFLQGCKEAVFRLEMMLKP